MKKSDIRIRRENRSGDLTISADYIVQCRKEIAKAELSEMTDTMLESIEELMKESIYQKVMDLPKNPDDIEKIIQLCIKINRSPSADFDAGIYTGILYLFNLLMDGKINV